MMRQESQACPNSNQCCNSVVIILQHPVVNLSLRQRDVNFCLGKPVPCVVHIHVQTQTPITFLQP